MTVYVVVCYDDRYEYGGYEEPCVAGVFATREAADVCAVANRRTDKHGYQTHALVVECDVIKAAGGE